MPRPTGFTRHPISFGKKKADQDESVTPRKIAPRNIRERPLKLPPMKKIKEDD